MFYIKSFLIFSYCHILTDMHYASILNWALHERDFVTPRSPAVTCMKRFTCIKMVHVLLPEYDPLPIFQETLWDSMHLLCFHLCFKAYLVDYVSVRWFHFCLKVHFVMCYIFMLIWNKFIVHIYRYCDHETNHATCSGYWSMTKRLRCYTTERKLLVPYSSSTQNLVVYLFCPIYTLLQLQFSLYLHTRNP